MSKRKNLWSLLTCMVIVAMLLAACGGAATEEPTQAPEPTAAPAETVEETAAETAEETAEPEPAEAAKFAVITSGRGTTTRGTKPPMTAPKRSS